MGKFLNTNKKSTVNSLVEGIKHRLDNPFYIFNDKEPTVVTFYNVNDTKTSLDDGSKQAYDVVGSQSPIVYNEIKDVFLYGIERISAELDIGEYGIEAGEITGECYLPPNSFKPIPESYFTINHVTKNKCWFRVTKVTMDTLENGNNFWKLDYIMDQVGEDFGKELKLDKKFTMFIDHVGSNYKSVLQDEVINFISRMEDVIDTLITYYNSLFFQQSLQTYVFKYEHGAFYDPEIIEFIIRNHILHGSDYIYIEQAITLEDTFAIQYNKSIYKKIEDCDKNIVLRRYYGMMNEDPMSLLATRLEDYYIITPANNLGLMAEPIMIFPPEMIGSISKNIKYTREKEYLNIIGNYFNDQKDLNDKMIDSLESINYTNDAELYHTLPIIIFILQKEVKKLLNQNKSLKNLM